MHAAQSPNDDIYFTPKCPSEIVSRADQLDPFVRVNVQSQISWGFYPLIVPSTPLEIASSLYQHPSATREEAFNTSHLIASAPIDLAMSLTPRFGGRS